MSYSEVADIQAEFKSIAFDEDDSAITTEKVQDFIAQADAKIDSIISVRYIVPIAKSAATKQALLVLKMCSIWLVAQRVKDIVEAKTARPETDQDARTNTAKQADDLLAKIADGSYTLIGATLANSQLGVKSFVSSNNVSRTFKRDTDQW